MSVTSDGTGKFRNRRRRNFTQVDNAALLNANLSLSEKGLLTIMLGIGLVGGLFPALRAARLPVTRTANAWNTRPSWNVPMRR